MTARTATLRPRKSVTRFTTDKPSGETGLKQYRRLFSEEDELELELKVRKQASDDRRRALALGQQYNPRLFKFEELPVFLQDNEFIRSGYRLFYSYPDLWRSVFRLHNETGNIWTHLLGFCLCVGLMIQEYRYFPEFATVGDRAIFFVFFLCAQSCFLFSTLFHTHFCHSKWAFVKFGCLDYAGISSMICGSCCIVTYFAFYCESTYRAIYLTFTVLCASVGILGPFKDKWAHRSFRKWRTLIYVASAVSSAFPLLHYLVVHGFPVEIRFELYYGVFKMAFLYLFGAFIYASRIPERFKPGKFDIYFHSHQWWHVCVVLAWYVHYNTALNLMEWRMHPGACKIKS